MLVVNGTFAGHLCPGVHNKINIKTLAVQNSTFCVKHLMTSESNSSMKPKLKFTA